MCAHTLQNSLSVHSSHKGYQLSETKRRLDHLCGQQLYLQLNLGTLLEVFRRKKSRDLGFKSQCSLIADPYKTYGID